MLPKVEACVKAAAAGCAALIIDGRQAGALRSALEGQVAGTRVTEAATRGLKSAALSPRPPLNQNVPVPRASARGFVNKTKLHDAHRVLIYNRAMLKTNALYYGDNLEILRDYVPDESVDLIYLDPPFNSNRSYNVLFKETSSTASQAQIEAFEDTWHWGKVAQGTFEDIALHGADSTARLLKAMVDALGHNDVTAYLTMMAVRLVELRRVLKPTGSIYLHCDPSASHYLKMLMDSIFRPAQLRNEIIWKRYDAHNDVKGASFRPRCTIVLLYYAKSARSTSGTVRFTPSTMTTTWTRLSIRPKRARERGYGIADLTGPGGATAKRRIAYDGMESASPSATWALSAERRWRSYDAARAIH